MAFKCKKCLRVKNREYFTITIGTEKICDPCCEKIEDANKKRNTEMKRFVNCESKTPVLTGYGETKQARDTQRIRNGIDDILEQRRLDKELEDYE